MEIYGCKDATKINERLAAHAAAVKKRFPNNPIFYLALYGSQNYKIDTPDSDVDTKCIILPTTDEIILGKNKISEEVEVDGEICCVKDIREMFANYYNGNINFTETLFTKYYYIEDSKYLSLINCFRDEAELIATRDPIVIADMITGMVFNKMGRFEDNSELGYNVKHLKTIYRLRCFICTFYEADRFEEALVPNDIQRTEIRDIMAGKYWYERAKEYAEDCVKVIKDYRDRIIKREESTEKSLRILRNEVVSIELNNIIRQVLGAQIVNDLKDIYLH